ncbi:MAG: hypothetical protein Ct9H90mP6_12160 [Gammaproteobacteria bacterium]|nr:MAG: hypothetical protein Ct9H90mP6_12160 [Gammaproteobacteria bacterium]
MPVFFLLMPLSEICDQNEINAAKNSLNAELIHWQDGKKFFVKNGFKTYYQIYHSQQKNLI